MMMTFGSAWLVYGLLSGQLDKDPVSSYADLAIGVSTLAVGWGVGKLFTNEITKWALGIG